MSASPTLREWVTLLGSSLASFVAVPAMADTVVESSRRQWHRWAKTTPVFVDASIFMNTKDKQTYEEKLFLLLLFGVEEGLRGVYEISWTQSSGIYIMRKTSIYVFVQ